MKNNTEYSISESVQAVPGQSACPQCGGRERHAAMITLGRIPVDKFAVLVNDYEARWPGCRIVSTANGYLVSGPHACGCAESESAAPDEIPPGIPGPAGAGTV